MSNSADTALAGALRRFKRYEAYKDSGVEWLGKIPDGWEVKRLKEVALLQMSTVDKKSVEGEQPVALCNYTDVYYQDRINSEIDFMKATAPRDQIRRFALRAGDVLITKDSESWTDIAVPAVVTEDLPNVLCGYHLAHIRPQSSVYGPYLARAIGAVGPRDQFRVAANGVTRFAIGTDAIATSVFAIPSFPEQRAIAAFLDRETERIDALVAKKERLITLLQERRTALITRAVTKGLDPAAPMKDSGVEWLGEIPAHWEVKRADAFLDNVKRQVEPAEIASELVFHYSIPSLQSTGDGQLEAPTTIDSAKLLVVGEQLLVSKLNPRKGVVLIATEKSVPTIASTEFVPFRPRECDLRWALYLMLADSTRQRLSATVRSATRSHQRAEVADIAKAWHPVPGSAEQRNIVSFLDQQTARIDDLVARIRTAITHLHEHRTALISAAVTGKIDVREAAQ